MPVIPKKHQKQLSPSFYILETPLPATLVEQTFLGRIVADINNPTDDYVEVVSRGGLEASFIVEEKDYLLDSAERNSSEVQAKIGHLLGAESLKSKAGTQSLQSSMVRTRKLQQHHKALGVLLDAHRETTTSFIRAHGRVGHMVVGFKSAADLGRARGHDALQHVKAAVQVPVQEAIGSAVGMPITGGNAVNPTASIEQTIEQHAHNSSTIEGETIFAVQYRPLRLRMFSANDAQLGPMERFHGEAAAYGSEQQDGDHISGSPDSLSMGESDDDDSQGGDTVASEEDAESDIEIAMGETGHVSGDMKTRFLSESWPGQT